MTNPTSNFGWQMPTSTDLVTDLPADFAVFGQAVDTSMADLKGGTTGQILSKATATDMDFTWITNDVGDITAVTAGTGISGGGTSGAVTITNSMATAITTAGDLIKGTGSGTFDRLGIGSTGQVLTVAAGAPSWATPTSGSMTQLATGTLSGASVSITSISGSYQDLVLVITKFRPATDGANLWLRMNNVTAANYASSTSGAGGSSGTAGANQVTLTNQQDDTANSYSLMVFRFPQYANAITWKYLVGESVTNNSGDPLDINFSRPIGILSQTTAAITRIDLLSSSGNLTSGTYTLYGVI